MSRLGRSSLALVAAALLLWGAGPLSAHPGQHGPTDGHLLGSGEFGSIDLLSVERLTSTPELVADVAVSPDGQWAYLANWGEPDCAGPEVGGQTSPDAGVWVVDISDLEDPKQVGFIPSSQDTRPGEGMQVVTITTPRFSGDVLVMNNEHCGKNGKGGISLYDVTNPRKPVKLSEHFGDRANLSLGDTNDIHSAFAWDAGAKAYAVMVDNFETTDVDILDITNPKRPRLIRELDLDTMFPGITQVQLGLVQIFLHDIVVKQIDGHWVMLLSYWDGGYVQLNVDDPANPTLIGDTDFTNPDPELLESTGEARVPEGNGHQAEFTADNQYFIGTDEDFAPYGATDFSITSGTFAGGYPSVPVPGSAPTVILPDETLNGPVVYGGYGCPASAPIPSPSSIPGYEASLVAGEEKIVVLQRGPTGDPSATEGACFPGEKAHEAVLAGWDAVVFVQRHGGTENPPFCGSGAFVDQVVGVCTNHEAYHKMFNTPPFAPPWTYPDGPPIGTVGERIRATAAFDGWGYVHLFSNTVVNGKFAELDTYAIDEGHDLAYAVGFGDLTVHEVATHPQAAEKSYLSYYSGGLRALEIQGTELVEVGGYLDENGNNFWGVEVFVRDGRTIILGSDRDSGLWIFEDVG
ncbi:LVIVD repeat-containing protein [Nocardioides sp. NPDC051685]|uniref:LVIVD repeat-containing protein n=1 Tax=Nocardioides sp. NPDC051685 TaxID=3364334 RepID=UPI0037B49B23